MKANEKKIVNKVFEEDVTEISMKDIAKKGLKFKNKEDDPKY